MNKRWWYIALSLVLLTAAGYYSTRAIADTGESTVTQAKLVNDLRAKELVDEMRRIDVDKLEALAVKPLELPEAGIDVMRVRLEETYDIAGIGKDTVELKGWIAVRHDHTRPAEGEQVLSWNSAVTDTEFVAMKLHGQSPLFGPVEVTLDKTVPSVGQVGNLCFPFIVGSSLDAAYLPYRKLFKIDQEAANRTQSPSITLAVQKEPAAGKASPVSTVVTGNRARPIIAVIDGLLKAISAKDTKAMLRFYSPSGNNLFFGQSASGVTRGSEEYVRELSRIFDNLKTVEAKRNDDVQVRLSGKLAVATLTGTNNVVDTEGKRGSSPWRWTVELERGSGGAWQITHDHLSFFADPSQPFDSQEISSIQARGKCCLANLSVAVNLSNLDLEMRTGAPVRWYSEVETIPPVGTTVSVSVTPTPLIANGRPVGTLQHGAVKFREVVRHVPLIDVVRPDLRIASIRTLPRTAGR